MLDLPPDKYFFDRIFLILEKKLETFKVWHLLFLCFERSSSLSVTASERVTVTFS